LGDKLLIIYPSSTAIKAKTIWLEKLLATHFPDLVGPPEEGAWTRAGRACCDVPGSVSLGSSSVGPLQERRVSESESVRAVIRRVYAVTTGGSSVPIPFLALALASGFWYVSLYLVPSPAS